MQATALQQTPSGAGKNFGKPYCLQTGSFGQPIVLAASANDCLDQLDFAVPHLEHVEIGQTACEKNIRDDGACFHIHEETPRAVRGDYEPFGRAVVFDDVFESGGVDARHPCRCLGARFPIGRRDVAKGRSNLGHSFSRTFVVVIGCSNHRQAPTSLFRRKELPNSQ